MNHHVQLGCKGETTQIEEGNNGSREEVHTTHILGFNS